MPEWLQIILVGSVVSFMAFLVCWIFYRVIGDNAATRKLIEDHIKECDETPNKLIIERFDRLRKDLENQHKELTDQGAEIKNRLENYHRRTGALEKAIGEAEIDIEWIKKNKS